MTLSKKEEEENFSKKYLLCPDFFSYQNIHNLIAKILESC